jgi:hypothetical protein
MRELKEQSLSETDGSSAVVQTRHGPGALREDHKADVQRVHKSATTGRQEFDCSDYKGDTKLEACLNNKDRLKPFDTGPTVAKVQKGLMTDGQNLGKKGVDEIYGPATGQAVMAFKKKYKLGDEQYPDVGPGTMTKLDELCVKAVTPKAETPCPPCPEAPRTAGCTPCPEPAGQKCPPTDGIKNSDCSAYAKENWWLPEAYWRNATCACQETPDVPTANCVRKFLQDRLGKVDQQVKIDASLMLGGLRMKVVSLDEYINYVQLNLTPIIYKDHVDAYAECCCPGKPAPLEAWRGVTTIALPCAVVGEAIRQTGSCSNTPGKW